MVVLFYYLSISKGISVARCEKLRIENSVIRWRIVLSSGSEVNRVIRPF